MSNLGAGADQLNASMSGAPHHGDTSMKCQQCNDYCCSLFANFVDDELTKTPDLTNHIHPIFRRTNFNGGQLSRDDYELLTPSLQLASQFLESESLVPFLVTMIDGKVQTESGLTIHRSQVAMFNDEGKVVQVYDVHTAPLPGQDELNDQTRKRASEILKGMADMITFQIDEDLEGNEGGAAEAVRGRLKGKLKQIFPNGCRSSVSIDRSKLERIRTAMAKARWSEARNHSKDCVCSQKQLEPKYSKAQGTCNACSIQLELLAAGFSLFEVSVHETGHCVYNAAWGFDQPDGEIPQAPDSVGEAGFETRQKILGGSLTIACKPTRPVAWIEGECNRGNPRPSGPMAFLEDWPNYGMLRRYQAVGHQLVVTERKPHNDAYHRIPLSYVEDLFTQAFWDNVKVNGPEAMEPPKVETWYFRWSDEKKNWERCTAQENERNMRRREMHKQDSADHDTVEALDDDLPPGLTIGRTTRAKRKRRLSDVGGGGLELRRYAIRT